MCNMSVCIYFICMYVCIVLYCIVFFSIVESQLALGNEFNWGCMHVCMCMYVCMYVCMYEHHYVLPLRLSRMHLASGREYKTKERSRPLVVEILPPHPTICMYVCMHV